MHYGEHVNISSAAVAVLIYSDELDRIMKKQAKRKTELARINREIWQDDARVAALEAEIRRLTGK